MQIKCSETGAKIYYTIDGSTPTGNSTLYTAPINISSTTTVKAIAVKNDKSSFVDQGTFSKIRDDIKLTLRNKYLPNYAGDGDETLIDGLHGTTNWKVGHWQGYQVSDLDAVIDMGTIKPIKSVSIGTLQDVGSWIVFPKQVEFYTSDDGQNFKLAATVPTKIDIKAPNAQTQEFKADLNLKTRYIRVVAKQYGPLPEWHEGKGQQSYIFADEITIE